ncbi:MAG TPA: hypothetical protein VGH15_02560 [Caulobacteraceae bacterium]|jgi:hypothetical protein
MEPAQALASTAEIAATIAGFTGIVVVFGQGSIHEWPLIHRFRLRLLLIFSVLPLVFSLLGLLVMAIGPAEQDRWKWCSGLAAALLLAGGLYAWRGFRAFAPRQFKAEGGGVAVFTLVALAGSATLVVEAWNAAALGAFWPFFLAIVLSMISAIVQFVRLVLSRPLIPPAV